MKADKDVKLRGAAKVTEALAEEHLKMQRRAYLRVRPYLVGALVRLRRAYPAFQTVVFNADKSAFAFVFGDGTQPREAPKAFARLRSACGDLARLSEIEWLTAGDHLWQVRQDGPLRRASEVVVQQYRHIEDGEVWHDWTRRPLREARYYVRQDIYSRTVYGSHRAGFGRRILDSSGIVVDEWIDPIGLMILRVLQTKAAPMGLEQMCDAMEEVAGFRDWLGRPTRGSFYIWDVFRACERLAQKGVLRRINPKAQEHAACFVLAPR